MAFDAIVESSTPTLKLPTAVRTTNADVTTWPWPRLFQTKYHLFCATRQASGNLYLSEVLFENGRTILTAVLDLGAEALIETIDIADFGLYYVVSTYGLTADAVPVPSIKTYVKNLSAVSKFQSLDAFTTPAMGVVCNYQGQLIGGNIVNVAASKWSDLNSDAVVWSGVGNLDFDPSYDFTAGFMSGQFPYSVGKVPTVFKIMPLHSRGLVIYSEAGKFYMTPERTETGFAYGVRRLSDLGITSGNHVAGDEFVHGFIDLHRDFWILESQKQESTPGGNYKKLGYRDYIQELFDYTSSEDHRVIVSYIPMNRRFYISNGNRCLIINEFGACHVFQSVSSIVKLSDGKLYGTFKNNPDTSALIITDELDFGSRGFKTIESIVGGVDKPKDAIAQYTVDWRQSRADNFSRLPWRNTSPRGEARIGVTAGGFRLGVRVSNYVDAEVEWLAVNIKFPDNRFKRGPSLAEANLVSTRNEA